LTIYKIQLDREKFRKNLIWKPEWPRCRWKDDDDDVDNDNNNNINLFEIVLHGGCQMEE